MYRTHNDNLLLLMSTKEGDLVTVHNGGAVQARLVVNRITGEVVHSPPGARIAQWEAEIMGDGEICRKNVERLRTAPFRPQDWKQLGNPIRVRPKEL